MKKTRLAVLLLVCLAALAGCQGVEQTLHELGTKIEDAQVSTPQNNGGDIDWSFVPVVRERAVSMFEQAFPEATVKETGVACRNTKTNRAIVTITYEMNGRTGTYGFDYEKNESGEYELTRYGDGVSADDL